MNELRPKRVRIQGKVGDTRSYQVMLTDVDTGEEITKVYSVIAVLDVETVAQAALLRYASTPEGRVVFHVEDGELVREQVIADKPEIDITVEAAVIDAPGQKSVLETFRTLRDWPVIQSLTCQVILVEGWKFEDMADFSIVPITRQQWRIPRGEPYPAWECRFAFRDGRVATMYVRQDRRGDFIVGGDHS